MDKYIIMNANTKQGFFHFTNEKNLNSIKQGGLFPAIGRNSRYIEKSEKVFFVEGLDNLLILFDCWINCYFYIPIIPFIYFLGAFFLRQKWFPMFIADGYFGVLKISKLHRNRAYKVFDRLLDESILLHLDLEENIDFKYDDIDEIKQWGYQKRHLEFMGYSPKYSNLANNYMDKWNMHLFSNCIVEPYKIKYCILENGSYKLRDIFDYCLNNTSIDIKNICPILYGYLQYKSDHVCY